MHNLCWHNGTAGTIAYLVDFDMHIQQNDLHEPSSYVHMACLMCTCFLGRFFVQTHQIKSTKICKHSVSVVALTTANNFPDAQSHLPFPCGCIAHTRVAYSCVPTLGGVPLISAMVLSQASHTWNVSASFISSTPSCP